MTREEIDTRMSKKKDLSYIMKETTYVYCLPSENYVGITNNLKRRMNQHSYNKDISNYYILAECSNRKEAIQIENIFHNINCKGNAAKERNLPPSILNVLPPSY